MQCICKQGGINYYQWFNIISINAYLNESYTPPRPINKASSVLFVTQLLLSTEVKCSSYIASNKYKDIIDKLLYIITYQLCSDSGTVHVEIKDCAIVYGVRHNKGMWHYHGHISILTKPAFYLASGDILEGIVAVS